MKRIIGGQMVGRGVFVSLRSGEFVTIPKEGGELAGQATVRYIKVPTGMAAIFGPVVGLAYVIFLPLVGLITLAWLLARLAGRAVAGVRAKTGQLTGAEWQPGMSYFARRRKGGKQDGEGTAEQLRKEIEEKRQEK